MTVRVVAPGVGLGPLTLSAEESHYLVRVRRARVGASIEVLHPDAGGWSAVVEIADTKRAVVELREPLPERPPWPIDLAVALPDTKAAHDVIARATECGARSLTFLQTRFSQPGRLNPERIARIVNASRRQCGRTQPLPVSGPTPADAWLSQPRRGFVASLGPPAADPPPRGEVTVLIGPEGGLSEDEERLAAQAGLQPLSLGPYVLRTEVAVTAALAAVGKISGA